MPLMQEPFPALTNLQIKSRFAQRTQLTPDEPIPVLPDSFLGGSAPRLQFF